MAVGLSMAVLLVVVVARGWMISRSPEGELERAEAAEAAKDWPTALAAWRAVIASPLRKGGTWLAEARAALALG